MVKLTRKLGSDELELQLEQYRMELTACAYRLLFRKTFSSAKERRTGGSQSSGQPSSLWRLSAIVTVDGSAENERARVSLPRLAA